MVFLAVELKALNLVPYLFPHNFFIETGNRHSFKGHTTIIYKSYYIAITTISYIISTLFFFPLCITVFVAFIFGCQISSSTFGFLAGAKAQSSDGFHLSC